MAGCMGVTQIGLGDAHACARLGNGQARCWGRNTFGALGNGTDDASTSATGPAMSSSSRKDVSVSARF